MKTIKFFWVSLFIIAILGMVTAAYDCEQEVIEGQAHEKAEMWSTAGIDYGIACGCYDRQMKDYDTAIKYCEKSSEMFEKAEILSSAGGTHLTLAEIYSKKGENEDKIKEHCEISKNLLMKHIEEEIEYQKTHKEASLISAASACLEIADCYKLMKDDKNACEYCKTAVGYEAHATCTNYGCTKSNSGTSGGGTGTTNTGTSASGSGELSIIFIAGIIVVIVLAVAVFFLKRKKEK